MKQTTGPSHPLRWPDAHSKPVRASGFPESCLLVASHAGAGQYAVSQGRRPMRRAGQSLPLYVYFLVLSMFCNMKRRGQP